MTAIALPAPRRLLPFVDQILEGIRGIKVFMAGFSDYLEKKVLDHVVGKTSFTMPSSVYVALVTVAVTDADTGSTITEANYTGYARKLTAGSDWNAATGTTAVSTSANSLAFAACTAGSSTVIGWALVDASSAGNILAYGTCTSVVISATQTPATIAAGALSVGLD